MPLLWIATIIYFFACVNATLHQTSNCWWCDSIENFSSLQIAKAVDHNNHLLFCLCKCHLSYSHQIVGNAISIENFPSFQNATARVTTIIFCFCLCKCYFTHMHQTVGDAISIENFSSFQIATTVDHNNHLLFCLCKCHFTPNNKLLVMQFNKKILIFTNCHGCWSQQSFTFFACVNATLHQTSNCWWCDFNRKFPSFQICHCWGLH